MKKLRTLHLSKPVQPAGRHATPLTLCGLKGTHHQVTLFAGHVTCGKCRKSIVRDLRAAIRKESTR